MSAYLFYLVAILMVTVPCAAMYCGRYDSSIKTHIFNPVAHAFILLILCFFFALSPLASLWFVLTPLALSIVALSCQSRQVSVSTGRWTVGAAALVITLLPAAAATSLMWRIQSRLAEFPLISLTDRLAYEADARTEIDSAALRRAIGDLRHDRSPKERAGREYQLPLASNVSEESLERLEGEFEVARGNLGQRQDRFFFALLAAHRDTTTQFTNAMGFGISRARPLSYQHWKLELPTVHPMKMTPTSDCLTEPLIEPIALTPSPDFQAWHDQNQINFAHPLSLGAVDWTESRQSDLSRVVGFQPHAFHSPPKPLKYSKPTPHSKTPQDKTVWQADRVSLVSLLKHRAPVAYVSESLPNMQELIGVPTRPLNEFESRSLEQLKLGEDLMVNSDENRIEMLGSIRAISQCMECHQVARGALLGAFSYRLSRIDLESSAQTRSGD